MPIPLAFGTLLRAGFKKLLDYAGPLALNVLLFFGLNFATQEFAIGPMIQAIRDALTGVPQMLMDTMTYVNGDKAITIILSAYAARAAGSLVLKRKAAP